MCTSATTVSLTCLYLFSLGSKGNWNQTKIWSTTSTSQPPTTGQCYSFFICSSPGNPVRAPESTFIYKLTELKVTTQKQSTLLGKPHLWDAHSNRDILETSMNPLIKFLDCGRKQSSWRKPPHAWGEQSNSKEHGSQTQFTSDPLKTESGCHIKAEVTSLRPLP